MNILRKMAGYFSRPVSIKDPASWPTYSADVVSSERAALSLSAVTACVRLLSGVVAGLPCQVFKSTENGGRDIVKDHPLYRLLHDSPNADQTAFEFWEQMIISLELRGNAYAVKDKIGGRVVSLRPIHPDKIIVRRGAGGRIEYEWQDLGLRHINSTSDDILHIRGFGGDALGGMSTLDLAANTLTLAKTINTAAQKSFTNGMNPSGVLTFKDYIPQSQRDLVKAAIQKDYSGAVNTGRPIVLEGGATWQQLSIKPEEAQMLESRGFSVQEICQFFGVPPFLIGHTEKMTSFGSGVSEQVQGFQKFNLHQRLERIEQRLMKELLTPEDRAQGFIVEFNLDGLLRADTFKRFQAHEIALRNGVSTINEVRRLENLPPVEGGDVPRMQSQNVPITYVEQTVIGVQPDNAGG